MEEKEQSLVSVTVITYNSSKTVLETLESIKAQTYQNLELIVSDDCSTDNTVEVCQKWIEENKSRFVRTELLTVEKNTGVAGNCNRAGAACQGEWVKGIAGDDILMPNCVQDCMDYVAEHPDIIYLFGKQKAFGASEERCKEIDAVFDYTFFNLTQEQQLHRLVFDGNCVPATTVFYNRERAKQLNIKEDERIPLLEDWPKWINLLRAGVKLHFVDKVLVNYRVGGVSTMPRLNPNMYRSSRLFCFFYQYPEWCEENQDKAVERVVRDEMEIYQYLVDTNIRLMQLEFSKAYRLGKLLLSPFRWMKRKK